MSPLHNNHIHCNDFVFSISGQILDILQAEEAIDSYYREGINQAFNWPGITWNDETIQDLQDSINNATMEREVCSTNRVSQSGSTTRAINIDY